MKILLGVAVTILIAISTPLLLLFLSPSLLFDDTYSERNRLLSALSESESERVTFISLFGEEYTYVCIFYPNGINPRNWPIGQEMIKILKIVEGVEIDDWREESLYRVIIVDLDGDAVVWNFDERLYKIRVEIQEGELLAYNGCLPFGRAYAIVAPVQQTDENELDYGSTEPTEIVIGVN